MIILAFVLALIGCCSRRIGVFRQVVLILGCALANARRLLALHLSR